MHTVNINNHFLVPLKTIQISFFINPELDLAETLTIKRSKLKIRKRYCKLYGGFIQTQLKINLREHFNTKWILAKRNGLKKTKTSKFSTLNVKIDYKKYRQLHVKGYTRENEFIYGFKKQPQQPKPSFFYSWETFKKFQNTIKPK